MPPVLLREWAQHESHTGAAEHARAVQGLKEMRQGHEEEEQLLVAHTEGQVNTKRICPAPQWLQPSHLASNPTGLLC